MKNSLPIHNVVKWSNVMLPMRDGVRLATDIYFPAIQDQPIEGLLPAIMERTPYDKTRAALIDDSAQYFASRGYVVIYQDTRGRFKSEGTFVKYLKEPYDGYDTLVWIGNQRWSTGEVGTFGISYGAHTQSALAALNPPNLVCTFMDSGGFTNAHDNSVRNGGTLELRQLVWAYTNAKTSPKALANQQILNALESEDLHDWFKRIPWKPGHSPLRWVPEYEDYIFEMWTQADFNEYWRQLGICNELYFDQYSDVPQLHIGSWYDPYTKTTIKNFTGLRDIKTGPIHMILGPWTHGAHDISFAGDVDFGPQSIVAGNLADDYNDLRLRWFDLWLKGIKNSTVADPLIRVFIMGGGDGHRTEHNRLYHGGEWRNLDAWPPTEGNPLKFYFHGDGSLSTEKPCSEPAATVYQFDPKHPVPTIGGNISSGGDLIIGGAFNQREGKRFYGSEKPYLPLSSRHDVLVFQTQPLDQNITVIGPIVVKLWASSSVVDTDFTAKLVDVHPPTPDFPRGFDMNLSDGIIRARYRNSPERQEFMTPHEVYEFVIDLYPTANRFTKGHRIRVDLSSSNFPRLDVNPNTGGPQGRTIRTEIAENTIYHDETRPSHIKLWEMRT